MPTTAADHPLSKKAARFVEEYLVTLNATAAAIAAGYSEDTAYAAGGRLLKDPRVIAAVSAAQLARSERTHLTQDYVVANLREVLERCMQRAPVMVRDGKKMVQLVDADGRHVWQFDAKGANAALLAMGKHLGMYTEKRELSGAGGGPIEMTITHVVIDPAKAAPPAGA